MRALPVSGLGNYLIAYVHSTAVMHSAASFVVASSGCHVCAVSNSSRRFGQERTRKGFVEAGVVDLRGVVNLFQPAPTTPIICSTDQLGITVSNQLFFLDVSRFCLYTVFSVWTVYLGPYCLNLLLI